MSNKRFCAALVFFVVSICKAVAQDPAPPARLFAPIERTDIVQQTQPPEKEKKAVDKKAPDKTPDKTKRDPEPKIQLPATNLNVAQPSQNDIFAQSPARTGQVLPFFNPQMMGDFFTYSARQSVSLLGNQTTSSTSTTTKLIYNDSTQPTVVSTTTTSTAQSTVHEARTVYVPVANRGSFNIAENESPMPQDRVFFYYNSFNDVRGPLSASYSPYVTTTTTTTSIATGDNTTTKTTTVTKSVINGAPQLSLNREVLGFEKTFFDGRASVESRVPGLEQPSSIGAFSASEIGDLTIIGKYAFYLDRTTNNVISGGLAVTAPNSSSIQTTDGSIHSTLIQPYVGYLWNFNDFYIQAFHSVVVPTDSRDVTLLFNDVGINYWLYRSPSSRVLTSIVPTLEAHVTTPLNHNGSNDPLLVPNTVVMTGGVHFGLFKNGTLTFGAATPVTAPRPFGVEGFVQLNWRF